MKVFAEVFSNISSREQNKFIALIRKVLLPFMPGRAVNRLLVESS